MHPSSTPPRMNGQRRWSYLALGLAWLFLVPGCLGTPSSPVLPAIYSLHYDTQAQRQRIALIIPGLGQAISDPAIRAIAADYQARGITPVLVAIQWQRVGLKGLATAASRISHGVRQAFPGARICLFGFSFGAVIAFELSASLHPEHALLGSLSPVFKEDRKLQIFPLGQAADFFLADAPHPLSYARNQGQPFIFLYGEHDSFLINQAILAHRHTAFSGSRTITVKNAGHKLNPAYLLAIKKLILEIP